MANSATICALFVACFSAPMFAQTDLFAQRTSQQCKDSAPDLLTHLIELVQMAYPNILLSPYDCGIARDRLWEASDIVRGCTRSRHVLWVLAHAGNARKIYNSIRSKCSSESK
ncbi:hypothetical protein V1264_012715 [Littorina saxatilis]|uniref:Uncharacterized protein n=1 Tax=Littorina saxatilis TaxID=31220 RepID=A0AAN9BYH0_9CAEN